METYDFKNEIIDKNGNKINILDVYNFNKIKESYITSLKNNNYSQNTIKTYSSIIHKFTTYLKNQIAIYNENKKICDDLFLEGRRTLSVQEYMLKNKADCAFKLLDATKEDLVSPKYIREAIKWIKE